MGRIHLSSVVLAVALSLLSMACDSNSNPIAPSRLSTGAQTTDQPTASAQPAVTLAPPIAPAPPAVGSGQPQVTLPAPPPLPMPDVIPTQPGSQPGSTAGGAFTVSK